MRREQAQLLRDDDVPYVLLPYQQAWLADPAPVAVAVKARRIGLTWAEAAACVLTAAEAQGMDVWYLAYSAKQAEEFVRDCADWARHFDVAASAMAEEIYEDEKKAILAYGISFTSGYRITALSSHPRNLRGKQGRVISDESAFHPDLPAVLKAAMALLMWGGKVRLISSLNGDEGPFAELVQDCYAGKKPYSVHRITLDDALSQGLYQRICLVTGQRWTPEAEAAWRDDLIAQYGQDSDEELFCIPKAGGGAYLVRSVIEQCMIANRPVLRLKLPSDFATRPEHARVADICDWCERSLAPVLADLPPDLKNFVGEDFGRSGDATSIAVLVEAQNLTYDVPFMVELHNVPFEQQRQIFFYLCDHLARFAGAALDATGNGAYLAEVAMQRYGPRVQQVKFSEPWYIQHMPPFRSAMEETTLTVPKDADILADLRAIAMVKGVAKIPEQARYKGSDGGERHGDAAMALVLGHYAARAGLGEAAGAMTQTDTQTYHSNRQARRRVW